MIELEEGYYWIKFKDDLDDICIGYCNDSPHLFEYRWTISGDVRFYDADDVIVLAKIEDYKEIWESNK